MEIYLNQKRIRVNPKQAIGKGGEADVFDLGNGKALKLFKQPDHPDYQNFPDQQQASRDRLATHQSKLRQFPQNLPPHVVKPETLATNKLGTSVLGYTMPLLQGTMPLMKYSDRSFRSSSGIDNQAVVKIFQDLHSTIAKLHIANIVIGDFNDLNILIKNGAEAYIIDADSWQFDQFYCQMFTARFVDPLLCDRAQTKPLLQQPHNPDSDWYAFTVMLMESLLFVNPYGGMYKPKDIQAKIPHEARSLKGITIFHPEVQYPKPAIPYKVLSDDLLQYFHSCFERDFRGEFPVDLINSLQWQQCRQCGVNHVRITCPVCEVVMPIKSVTKDKIIITSIFRIESTVIICAAMHRDRLCWLYHNGSEFKREDHSTILMGDRHPHLQFKLQGKTTLIGKQQTMISLTPNQSPQSISAEAFDVNGASRFWISNGQLLKDGSLGSEYIGDVLSGQTRFWVGSQFGFGFYRAGMLNVAFVFDTKRSGINDRVQLPAWHGELIGATCAFSENYCWFFLAFQERSRIRHRVSVIQADGSAIATLEAEKGSSDWLNSIHGKAAFHNFLLAATDAGVIKMEVKNGQIIKVKDFPETEPFVNADSHLYISSQGLYVVDTQQIQLLKLN